MCVCMCVCVRQREKEGMKKDREDDGGLYIFFSLFFSSFFSLTLSNPPCTCVTVRVRGGVLISQRAPRRRASFLRALLFFGARHAREKEKRATMWENKRWRWVKKKRKKKEEVRLDFFSSYIPVVVCLAMAS